MGPCPPPSASLVGRGAMLLLSWIVRVCQEALGLDARLVAYIRHLATMCGSGCMPLPVPVPEPPVIT